MNVLPLKNEQYHIDARRADAVGRSRISPSEEYTL
jgi:hypothetical protein